MKAASGSIPELMSRLMRYFPAAGSRSFWVVFIIGVLMIAHFLPLLEIHSGQDSCSFGIVSNERYHELLAVAKRKQATEWPPLVWDNARVRALLDERFNDLSRGMTSVYERLAAMHAVMRALGAEYRRTDHDSVDPYEVATEKKGVVFFFYQVDLNKLGFFMPIFRQLRIGAIFNAGGYRPSGRERLSKQGDIAFGVAFPNLLENYQTQPRSEFGEVCPRMPSREWVKQFEESSR